jgi:hypothetical protein
MKKFLYKILVGTGLVGVAMAAGAIVQPADVTGEFLQKSFVNNGVYEQTFDIPDGAIAMKVAVSRDAWTDKGDGIEVIKVTSDWFDGKEWQIDRGIGGFTTDGGVRLDEKGQISTESANEGYIPEGIGRKIRIRVISKSDFTSTVSVKFQTPSKTILGRLFNMAWAAVAHTQTPAGGNDCASVISCTLAFGSNTTAGNMIAVGWRYSGGGRTVTLSDTRSNTYTSDAIESIDSGDSDSTDGVGYALNIASGADTVTFATNGLANTKRFSISEYSGVATASAIDKTSQAIGNGTTATCPSVTPAVDGELFFAVVHLSTGATFTAGTDFTLNTTVPTGAGLQRLATERYIQPTAAAHSGVFTFGTASWGCAMATFQPTGGAVITPVQVNAPRFQEF